MVYKKQNLWFFATKYLQLYPDSQNCVFKNEILFPELPYLGSPKSHQHDSKLNKNSKFKPIMFND
jgi:hypothetical protein